MGHGGFCHPTLSPVRSRGRSKRVGQPIIPGPGIGTWGTQLEKVQAVGKLGPGACRRIQQHRDPIHGEIPFHITRRATSYRSLLVLPR